MGRYQRRSEEVDAMMVEAYVSGVSQRKMGDVTEALMGGRVGRSTVSRVAKRLDEGVQTLRSAPVKSRVVCKSERKLLDASVRLPWRPPSVREA